MSAPRPLTDRDALYAGWVAGIARANGLEVIPLHNDDGIVTDHFEVRLRLRPLLSSAAVTITLIVPPAPDDWHPWTDGEPSP